MGTSNPTAAPPHPATHPPRSSSRSPPATSSTPIPTPNPTSTTAPSPSSGPPTTAQAPPPSCSTPPDSSDPPPWTPPNSRTTANRAPDAGSPSTPTAPTLGLSSPGSRLTPLTTADHPSPPDQGHAGAQNHSPTSPMAPPMSRGTPLGYDTHMVHAPICCAGSSASRKMATAALQAQGPVPHGLAGVAILANAIGGNRPGRSGLPRSPSLCHSAPTAPQRNNDDRYRKTAHI
jgi:hypothetical protein